mgnify:CR=1 FL=1
MFNISEKSLVINEKNVESIKKYGIDKYLILEYMRNDDYLISNKNGEMIYSDDCTEEEIFEFLDKNIKLYERLKIKLYCDTLIIYCENLDDKLLELIINDSSKKIIMIGVLDKDIDKSLLEKIFLNGNCYYDCNKIIDSSLLSLINKSKKIIESDDQKAHIYFSDTMSNIDQIFMDIIAYIKDNKIKNVYFAMTIDNPKIIIDFMPHIIEKLNEMGIIYKIEYGLTKHAEDKMAENYAYYTDNQSTNGSIISSKENMTFGSIDYYIDFMRMVDIIMTRIPENASELDKVVYISMFVINYMSYVNHPDDYSEYEILKKGTGVCRDYAKITEYLLKKIGIKCEIVSSQNYEKNDLTKWPTDQNPWVPGHEFNIVYIDNQPYFIDNTWENDTSLWLSNYFLVSLEEFKKTHSEYHEIYNYDCKMTYSRKDIEQSVKRVSKYEKNYIITAEQLKLLLKQDRYEYIERATMGYKIGRNIGGR